MKSEKTLFQLLSEPFSFSFSFGKPIPCRQVLVLAPHPDDEVLGCGGVLLCYLEKETPVTVLYLTDGRFGFTNTTSQLRYQEAQKLKERLPTLSQSFMNIPDGSVNQHRETVSRALWELTTSLNPDLIFVPWLLDRSEDHRFTALCLAKCLKELGIKSKEILVSSYEIMTPLWANYTVNITAKLEEKESLLDTYESQLQYYNLKTVIRELNRYRAALMRRPEIIATESFSVSTGENFYRIAEMIHGNPFG